MSPFTYVCFWKCCTSIKALFFLFTKFHNTKLRTVPHGTVRKVRLVRIFITRTNVPYPYLSNNYVPYKRTVLFAEKWSVPYRTCVPYRTVLPSLMTTNCANLLETNSALKSYLKVSCITMVSEATELQWTFCAVGIHVNLLRLYSILELMIEVINVHSNNVTIYYYLQKLLFLM